MILNIYKYTTRNEWLIRPKGSPKKDPADLFRPGTDEDEEEDRDILFVPRMERGEEPPLVPNTVQAAPDCEIINMVKTLNGGDSLHFSGHRTNPEGV